MSIVSINKTYPDGDTYAIRQDNDYPGHIEIIVNNNIIASTTLFQIIRYFKEKN